MRFGLIVPRFLELASRGMSEGVYSSGKTPKFCVEACIFLATNPKITDKELDLANRRECEDPDGCYEGKQLGDLVHARPDCVDNNLRLYKIDLNDHGPWLGEKDRAKHLIRIGIAQIGSAKTFAGKGFKLFAEYQYDLHGEDFEQPHNRDGIIEDIFDLENFLVKMRVPGAVWLRKNGHRYKGIPKRREVYKGLV